MEKIKNDLKSYTLSTEEVETLLQADYGDKIIPVNHAKLQKQQRDRQRLAAMQDRFKARNTENVKD
ncbi:hypothetical protein Ga0466249_004219 [Sporomusaceae bacterium BoRhaA]|jgi:hypothetical protein|uniref:hypothetical protein n=1 Tax=Pelorhabdus rhamnosifermentans TaxID=2772457 RepID=UPI001C05F131|nr:hypothetical protein [Pelorhabdus rhamnosifermentans]MBU2703083.1 hypothetical protein [Pelorhabdus rhamnosifermentans]